MIPTNLEFDRDGLITVVAQDAATAQVRMVGWMTAEALDLTTRTGDVHFWSRSRQTMWRKGATSGNTLRVVDIAADCDGDTLLIKVEAAGPTCHTGSQSCFGDAAIPGFAWLDQLESVIVARITDAEPASYTAELASQGVEGPARKLLEEAGEVVLAAKDHAGGGAADRVTEESADLVYHLLVLLAERGLEPCALLDELGRRAR